MCGIVGYVGAKSAETVVTRDGEPLNTLLIVTDSTRRDFVSAYEGADERADTPSVESDRVHLDDGTGPQTLDEKDVEE